MQIPSGPATSSLQRQLCTVASLQDTRAGQGPAAAPASSAPQPEAISAGREKGSPGPPPLCSQEVASCATWLAVHPQAPCAAWGCHREEKTAPSFRRFRFRADGRRRGGGQGDKKGENCPGGITLQLRRVRREGSRGGAGAGGRLVPWEPGSPGAQPTPEGIFTLSSRNGHEGGRTGLLPAGPAWLCSDPCPQRVPPPILRSASAFATLPAHKILSSVPSSQCSRARSFTNE